MRYPLAIVAALAAFGIASAQGPPMGEHGMMGPGGHPGPPPFLAEVFPPPLVMQHQQELGLKPAQIDAIKQAMADTQQQLMNLQWDLDAASEALTKMLAADHVDPDQALSKLATVTGIEAQVKRANFALLIRIKNALEPPQQAKLRALRGTPAPAGAPPPGGTPPPP